jgi:hypothetical protein
MNLTDHPDTESFEIGKLPIVAWMFLVAFAAVSFLAAAELTSFGLALAAAKILIYLVTSAAVLLAVEYLRTAVLFPSTDNGDEAGGES